MLLNFYKEAIVWNFLSWHWNWPYNRNILTCSFTHKKLRRFSCLPLRASFLQNVIQPTARTTGVPSGSTLMEVFWKSYLTCEITQSSVETLFKVQPRVWIRPHDVSAEELESSSLWGKICWKRSGSSEGWTWRMGTFLCHMQPQSGPSFQTDRSLETRWAFDAAVSRRSGCFPPW